MNKDWGKDYLKYKPDYQLLQKEVKDFLSSLVKQYGKAIDIVKIEPRPGNKIKSKVSIEKNLANSTKYKNIKNFLDIKDIAGIRITCHCENDLNSFTTLLEGKLRQKEGLHIVDIKDFRNQKPASPYRAVHFTISKTIQTTDNKSINIFCEIQVRTVMADAWAIQNHKYLYKKRLPGEAHDLTGAVSEIMNGCEKLWALVKNKSLQKDSKALQPKISEIQEDSEERLDFISKKLDQTQALEKWFSFHKSRSSKGLKNLDIKTCMEVQTRPLDLDLNLEKRILREGAGDSTIQTFGWPIGVVLGNREEYAPRIDPNGIHAEISIKEHRLSGGTTYDYWAIHTSGAFYLLKSLFEDTRNPKQIFFNTRIVRITEVFMYLKNLYENFKIPRNAKIEVTITHGGLKGRVLASSSPNRMLFRTYKIITNKITTSVETSLMEIEAKMIDIVEKFTKPLFEQFDFFELSRKILEEIVVNYLNGKVV